MYSVGFLMCDPPHNARRPSESENTSYDMLEPAGMDDFGNPAKELIKPGSHVHVFCSVLQLSS